LLIFPSVYWEKGGRLLVGGSEWCGAFSLW